MSYIRAEDGRGGGGGDGEGVEVMLTCWRSGSGLVLMMSEPQAVSLQSQTAGRNSAAAEILRSYGPWGHTHSDVGGGHLTKTKLPPLPFNPVHQLSIKTCGVLEKGQNLVCPPRPILDEFNIKRDC